MHAPIQCWIACTREYSLHLQLEALQLLLDALDPRIVLSDDAACHRSASALACRHILKCHDAAAGHWYRASHGVPQHAVVPLGSTGTARSAHQHSLLQFTLFELNELLRGVYTAQALPCFRPCLFCSDRQLSGRLWTQLYNALRVVCTFHHPNQRFLADQYLSPNYPRCPALQLAERPCRHRAARPYCDIERIRALHMGVITLEARAPRGRATHGSG